jgi:ATP-dependent DNA helicase PIF1
MEWLLLLILGSSVGLKHLRRATRKNKHVMFKTYKIPNRHKSQLFKLETNKIQLSQEQQYAYDFLEQSSQHVFLTGKAGTGKTLLLKHFVASTHKRIVVVAPTGAAAMNVRGQTLHSLFKLPSGYIDSTRLNITNETRQLLRNVDAIIIDEVSMVRADVIDGIDHILRVVKRSTSPFGGAQIIAFGDVYQLPPVVESIDLRKFFIEKYGGPYFFNALVWKEAELKIHELQTVFRQTNHHFKQVLDAIRNGSPTLSDYDVLRRRIVQIDELPKGNTITLTSTNAAAQTVNSSRLNQLKTKEKSYFATIKGSLAANAFPTDSNLNLKIGAQVIFLRNDPAGRWVNGTTGVIRSFSKYSVNVACGNRTYEVLPVTWDRVSYYFNEESGAIEQKVTSSFTQLPLKLAWAITIHKSQGCTYQRVIIDLRDGVFAHGQTYVALSRCTSLQGLYLLGEISQQDIITEPMVVSFMKQAQKVQPLIM